MHFLILGVCMQMSVLGYCLHILSSAHGSASCRSHAFLTFVLKIANIVRPGTCTFVYVAMFHKTWLHQVLGMKWHARGAILPDCKVDDFSCASLASPPFTLRWHKVMRLCVALLAMQQVFVGALLCVALLAMKWCSRCAALGGVHVLITGNTVCLVVA